MMTSQIDGLPVLQDRDLCRPRINRAAGVEHLTPAQQLVVLRWLADASPVEFEVAVHYALTRYPSSSPR